MTLGLKWTPFVILSGAVGRSEGSLRSFGPYGPQDDGKGVQYYGLHKKVLQILPRR